MTRQALELDQNCPIRVKRFFERCLLEAAAAKVPDEYRAVLYAIRYNMFHSLNAAHFGHLKRMTFRYSSSSFNPRKSPQRLHT